MKVTIYGGVTIKRYIATPPKHTLPTTRLIIPAMMEENEVRELHLFLIKNCFIEAATTIEQTAAVFGENIMHIIPRERIVWIKSKQRLRELLELAYEPMINAGSVSMSTIAATCPFIFTKSDKKVLQLNNDKKDEENSDYPKMVDFFRNLREKNKKSKNYTLL